MMQFSNPLLLWSMAGLAIPIGIHLLSRKEGKILRLGSIRHVQETSTQQFKGIRLNEILLLALRCSIIILLSLMISGLQITQKGNTRWLVVEKGLESHPRVSQLMDSLISEGYEGHFLSDNFPRLSDSTHAVQPENYLKLLDQLESKQISDVIVFAQNRVDGFKGPISSLPGNIRWVGIPSDGNDFELVVTRLKNDSVLVRTGHTSSGETHFTSTIIHNAAVAQTVRFKDTIKILLISDKPFNYDEKIMKASLTAIQESLPVIITFVKPTAGTMPDWCFWFSDKNISDMSVDRVITLRPQPANQLVIRTNQDRWEITQHLNEEVALKENLTLEMARLLLPSQKLWKTAKQNDRRMFPDGIVWSSPAVHSQERHAGINMMPAEPYLVVFILALLLVERIISYQRNQ